MKKSIFVILAFAVACVATGGIYYSLRLINSEKENTNQPQDEMSVFLIN